MEIKITPFILFLILLITLVISMLFGNSFLLKRENDKEGFVSFGYTNTDIMKVYIPQYSADETKKVIYLYDNLYFDGTNGNLIEVDSTYCSNARVTSNINGNVSCNDSIGTSIKNIYITTRNQNTITYSTTKDHDGNIKANNTNESSTSIISSNDHFTYLTKCLNILDINDYKYQLFYASWDNDTYMHIMELNPTLNTGINIQSYYYNYDNAYMQYVPFQKMNNDIPPYKQLYSANDDSNNGKLYNDVVYKKSNIYQISKYVKYDLAHGYIIILNPTSNTYTLYSRTTGKIVENASDSPVENLSKFVSFVIPDNNNGVVVVMAHDLKTLIMIIHADSTQKQYILSYCVRFTDKEVHISSSSGGNLILNPETTISKDISNNHLPCQDELSCKWYYYFKTVGNDPSILFKNEYIKKTQVVPPVCPSCPTCPGVHCTDCSANSTNSTSSTSSSSDSEKDHNIAEEAVGGAVGLTKEVVGGAVGLTKEVVGGAVGLGKEVVGGTVGLVKGAVSGIRNRGKKKDESEKDSSTETSGSSQHVVYRGTPVDQYSYYGALHSKGGNFMPVTADFSSFRR